MPNGNNRYKHRSPVATASYKMLTEIEIVQPIKEKEAQRIKTLCPKGVFDIEDSGKLYVKNQKNCSYF